MSSVNYPKPHATFKEHGVTYVKHMVAPEVMEILVVMALYPGSFVIKKADCLAGLMLPGQPRINISREREGALLAWLKKDAIEVDGAAKYVLEDTTMDYIRGMERRNA